jgi:hypothetical protein
MNDERRKVLTKYLGLCWHEGRMPINCGYRCVKCGDTYVANRTFDNDPDMMDLFRKLTDKDVFNSFYGWVMWKHTYWSIKNYEEMIKFLFYDPERFCNLVAEWLKEVKK